MSKVKKYGIFKICWNFNAYNIHTFTTLSLKNVKLYLYKMCHLESVVLSQVDGDKTKRWQLFQISL